MKYENKIYKNIRRLAKVYTIDSLTTLKFIK